MFGIEFDNAKLIHLINIAIKTEKIIQMMSQRLEEFLKFKNLTKAEFARLIGQPQPTLVWQIKNDKISNDFIAKILDCFTDVNRDWLMYGDGQMFYENPNNVTMSNTNVNEDNLQILATKNYNDKQNNELIQFLRQQLDEKDKQIAFLQSILEKSISK